VTTVKSVRTRDAIGAVYTPDTFNTVSTRYAVIAINAINPEIRVAIRVRVCVRYRR